MAGLHEELHPQIDYSITKWCVERTLIHVIKWPLLINQKVACSGFEFQEGIG